MITIKNADQYVIRGIKITERDNKKGQKKRNMLMLQSMHPSEGTTSEKVK